MASAILEEYFQDWYSAHGRTLDLDEIHDDVARPEHPLHDRYEWDDGVAAREYRKQQIARDIRSVEIRYVNVGGDQASTRAWLNNREIGRGHSGYTATEDALQDPTTLVFLKAAMDLDIKNLVRRYQHLEGFYEAMRAAAEAAQNPPPKKASAKKAARKSGSPRSAAVTAKAPAKRTRRS
jgi:hypothetical protein